MIDRDSNFLRAYDTSGNLVSYTPATPADWPSPPTDVKGALDELASEASGATGPATPSVNLTDAVATNLFAVALTPGSMKGGLVDFAVFVSDGTEKQALVGGQIKWSAVNKAGTISSDVRVFADTPAFAESDVTKTISIDADINAGVNQVTIRATVHSGLVATTFVMKYKRTDLGSAS